MQPDLHSAALLHIDTLFRAIDFTGVFVGALGGALAAMRDERYHYDLIGVTGLAMVAALGGGITRDIILQNGPPLAFQDVRYLLTALAGAGVGILAAPRISRSAERVVLWVDALALGLFAVAGSTRALNDGLSRLPAVLLGVLTAVGGGSIRDVVSGRPPKIFERGQLHAIAAILGSVAFLACDAAKLDRSWSTLIGTLSCFGLRILAVQFDWRTRGLRHLFSKVE